MIERCLDGCNHDQNCNCDQSEIPEVVIEDLVNNSDTNEDDENCDDVFEDRRCKRAHRLVKFSNFWS